MPSRRGGPAADAGIHHWVEGEATACSQATTSTGSGASQLVRSRNARTAAPVAEGVCDRRCAESNTRLPVPDAHRVRFRPTRAWRAASERSVSAHRSALVAACASGIQPGPSTSSTSSAKSALSLAIQVTGGGGPSTDTGARAAVARRCASVQTSSVDM